MKPLKRAVLKEELLVVTGSFQAAILLQQMLFWSERVKDSGDFVKEETARILNRRRETFDPCLKELEESAFMKGWIFKSAKQLAEEVMFGSERTVAKFLNELVEMNFLLRRKNPEDSRDNTYQYRVDIAFLQQRLMEKGYVLDGYPLHESLTPAKSAEPSAESAEQNPVHTEPEPPPPAEYSAPSADPAAPSAKSAEQYHRLHPQITSQILKPFPHDSAVAPLPAEVTGIYPVQTEPKKSIHIPSFVRSFYAYARENFGNKAPELTARTYEAAEKTLDLLIRRDGFDMQTIADTLRWASRDEFWSQQVLSISELRKKNHNSSLTKFQKILAAREKDERVQVNMTAGGRIGHASGTVEHRIQRHNEALFQKLMSE